VCWRLARQLAREYGVEVTLWVDDPAVVASFLRSTAPAGREWQSEGVRLACWSFTQRMAEDDIALVLRSDLLIEAFACHLPEPVLEALGRQERIPCWINLEYLSAEAWVDEHHLLSSLLTLPGMQRLALPVQKTFFFPGFTSRTGGLLREAGLLERHEAWQADQSRERAALLERLAPALVGSLLPETVFVSLFSYETASLQSCLDAMARDSVPTLCLVPQGRSLFSAMKYLGSETAPQAGDIFQRGALTLLVIPFQTQDDYDHLLSLCDFNFVRGEDSFVRAQWAARPLLWHIYPQQGQTHLQKLEAFQSLQSAQLQSGSGPQKAASMALRQFEQFWNQGEDCRELWHHLRPQLPGLREQARKWQQQLAEMPDLAANLLRFCRSKTR